jgi:uncharacterized damage-inducible protein DinB
MEQVTQIERKDKMQAMFNASDTDLPSSVNGHISWLFRPLGRIAPVLAAMVLMFMPVSTARAQSNSQTPPSNPTNLGAKSDAQRAFENMKTLAGSWQGAVMGIPINFTIRAASSGTAILHEGDSGGGRPPNHEITMFYRDGDRLLATHYCDAGNRSQLEGKMSPDGKTIEFSFLDVIGGTRGGHLRGMAFTMIDANRHTIEATFVMPDGKPIPLRGEFQRTNVNLYAGNKRLYDGGAMLLLLSAQKMPEEHYGFKPTEVTYSFGQLLADVVNWQYKNCSAALGEKNSTSKIDGLKTSKADLITALREAFAYCGKAYDSMTDASATQLVNFNSLAGPVPMPRQQLLETNTGLNSLHYGNLMIYMRLKNIVPPSEDPEFLKQMEKLLKK